ncbi:polyprenyl synthetase family protein [Intestinimonas sp. MSJ-38]|uniref:polyprenyl synthetase family protein n=1 Tax=Intestinimonas sp. MSJ-38 TaxID=2841532 RepID=UPI001C126DF5|nr:farnesyl diphosphate synthase [Intestinimonas sp. MSJ-38]MBU5433573.1 polyprenyl synthetase family protein [Intestinimonas sp. MSJ-38]
MDMAEKLKEYARLTQEGLETYLPEQAGALKTIFQAARYSALAGGKRLRPALLMEFYALHGENAEKALPFACALEMVHTYSLIHDDLPCMDNDDLRRGKPTNHKVFGEATALLAGDSLLTRAFETMLCHCPTEIPAENALKAAGILAARAGMEGMIGGQVMDLDFETRRPEKEELSQMVHLKTGCLLMAACEMGCALAGAGEEEMKKARLYGEKLGLAFQIQDDILDVTGSTEKLGKPVGSDAENHKNTFVSYYGLEECRRLVEENTRQAVEAVALLQGSDFLTELARSLQKRDH